LHKPTIKEILKFAKEEGFKKEQPITPTKKIEPPNWEVGPPALYTQAVKGTPFAGPAQHRTPPTPTRGQGTRVPSRYLAALEGGLTEAASPTPPKRSTSATTIDISTPTFKLVIIGPVSVPF
jgi:hypothetical protein